MVLNTAMEAYLAHYNSHSLNDGADVEVSMWTRWQTARMKNAVPELSNILHKYNIKLLNNYASI